MSKILTPILRRRANKTPNAPMTAFTDISLTYRNAFRYEGLGADSVNDHAFCFLQIDHNMGLSGSLLTRGSV